MTKGLKIGIIVGTSAVSAGAITATAIVVSNAVKNNSKNKNTGNEKLKERKTLIAKSLKDTASKLSGVNLSIPVYSVHLSWNAFNPFYATGDLKEGTRGEMTIYRENGQWRVSHSFTWAKPVYDKFGVQTVSLTQAALQAGKTYETAIKSDTTKDITLAQAQKVLNDFAAEIEKDNSKIKLEEGDKFVINGIKLDKGSYEKVDPNNPGNKITVDFPNWLDTDKSLDWNFELELK